MGLLIFLFRVLKNFPEYRFYITLIVFTFLGNKMCKFYDVLLAGCNHSKGFQNILKYFVNFRKAEYDGVWGSLLC